MCGNNSLICILYPLRLYSGMRINVYYNFLKSIDYWSHSRSSAVHAGSGDETTSHKPYCNQKKQLSLYKVMMVQYCFSVCSRTTYNG